MKVIQNVFAGLAASALFWLLDREVFSLAPAYRTVGMVLAFVVFFIAAFIIRREGSGVDIASGSKIADRFDATIRDNVIESDGEVAIGSGNRIKGPAKIEISGLEINNRRPK